MNRQSRALVLALAAICSGGCTIMRMVEIVPQSHFTPPNSNVEPLGLVTGLAQSTTLMYPNLSAALVAQAYDDALKKKGGDLLLNVSVRRSAVGYLQVIVVTKVEVEGTAARMHVGKQQLGELRDTEVELLARLAPVPEPR